MTDQVQRAVVEAFYRAYDSRDIEQIAALLDDDVSWQIVGPKTIMQICGQWHGKAAVLNWFTSVVPAFVEFIRLDRDSLLVDGDRSALFGRIFSRHRESGRMICHQVAHFARYRNGKLMSFCVINDSLDAAEQFAGRHIKVTGETRSHDVDMNADVVVV